MPLGLEAREGGPSGHKAPHEPGDLPIGAAGSEADTSIHIFMLSPAMDAVLPYFTAIVSLHGVRRARPDEEQSNMKPFHCILLVLLSAPTASWAVAENPTELEPMVVTASRIPVPQRETGSSITIITAKEIAHRQLFTVADVLRNVPGLDVVQNGGLGRQTSVFIRGANSNQTLVLIDGVEANDPSTPGASFDFANLTVDNIERIEILRGAQSSLYGSDAIGGVIQIFTKRGTGKPSADFSAEGGSYGTWKLLGNTSGSHDALRWSASASHLKSAGFSAADNRLGNSEDDGYQNTAISARAGLLVSDNLDLDAAVRFLHSDTDLDNCGGRNCDDPNFTQKTDQLYVRGQGTLDLFEHFWRQNLRLSYNLNDRRFRDTLEPGDTFASDDDFRGEKLKLDWQNTLSLTDWDTLIFGITTETEWMDTNQISRQSATINGYYGENRLRLLDRFITTAGIRLDDHDTFGDKLTWRITQAVLIPETNTKLRGSYGKGFKAPSLFQLFAPAGFFGPVGNKNLKPESSTGWDIGVEQSFLGDRVFISATYFHNTFSKLIDFQFGSGYKNLDKARSNGVESLLEIRPFNILTLRGTYTYTNTEDNEDNQLLRRPRHKGSFDADLAITENGHFHVNVLMVGSRRFSSFAYREKLDPYVVVNLAGSYRVTSNLTLFGRIDNALDMEYSEVPGYGTSRVAGYGGVRLSF